MKEKIYLVHYISEEYKNREGFKAFRHMEDAKSYVDNETAWVKDSDTLCLHTMERVADHGLWNKAILHLDETGCRSIYAQFFIKEMEIN